VAFGGHSAHALPQLGRRVENQAIEMDEEDGFGVEQASGAASSMTLRSEPRLAWGTALFCIAMVVASLVLIFLDRGGGDATPLIAATTFGALGALVASRRPTNAVGWLLLGISAIVGTSTLAQQLAMHALRAGASPRGWPRWPAWTSSWLGGSGLSLVGMLILLLLLFPDGRPLSGRWRWTVWATVVISVGFAVGTALDPTPVQLAPHLPSLGNPLGVPAMAGFSNSPAFLLVVLLLVTAAASLFLRLRRSSGEERQQLKWFAYAVGVSVGAFVIAILLSSVSQALSNAASGVVFAFGFAIAVPGAAALAILRYGLYEIDVVINKTLVYFSLGAFITAVYVAIVVGIGAAIGRGSNPNVGLSILATAVVAVAFQPVRVRVQKLANRLVYGQRATPYEVLSEFSSRMAGTYATDDLLPRMARILGEGTGARQSAVWLRVGEELRAEAQWPSADEAVPALPLLEGELPPMPGASLSLPVHHRGELLGALSLVKPGGERLTPAEDKLARDLASGAGLVLRNVRLTEELLAQLDELQESRKRLVTAQDEERRKIERNIHDGAQQQLVAMAIKLNLAQSLARKDPGRTDEMLSQLKVEAQDALENLRDLARGIYPPLLADQGLVAALTSQARKSPVPVTVEADGIGRFPQDAEAAVYFCTLEALQNVAKYAQASGATVHLSRTDGQLEFEVTDDGVGFDPTVKRYGTGTQGMADRLAALGGELVVTSSPGSGTKVTGRIPIATPEPSPSSPNN